MRRLWPSTLVCIAVVVALSVALATIAGERFVGRAEQLGVIGGDVLFSDDFSGDLSQWSDAIGTWSIDNGELLGRGAGGGTDGWLYAGDTDWADYAVQTRVEFVDSEASFVLRSTGHWQNEYRIDLWAQSSSVHSNVIGAAKYADGVGALLPEDYTLSPVPITDISLVRLEVAGNNIDIYINDQFVLRITDQDAFPSGRIGLGVIWSLSVRFDDVVVTPLDGPTFLVSGRVTNDTGQPFPDVEITADGGHSATTYASGMYTLTHLITGTYTITPTLSGYVFEPTSQPITVPLNATALDFVGRAAKAWTFIYYLDGDDDNELANHRDKILNQLEAGAGNPDINVLALWDGNTLNDSARYKVQYDTDLRNLATYTVDVNFWPQKELDMGAVTTAEEYINWARENYPATHYALILLDHGSGLNGAMQDLTSKTLLSVADIGSVLASVTKGGIDKIDVLYIDACLMGMIEDAYQVRDYVDYYVASEDLKSVSFQPYARYGAETTSATTPEQLAILLSSGYAAEMSDSWMDFWRNYTISAADLSQLDALATAVDTLARLLKDGTYTQTLSTVQEGVQRFDVNDDEWYSTEDEYIDLYDFARLTKSTTTNSELQIASQAVMDAVDDYIIDEHHQTNSVSMVSDSHGVSIFFPREGFTRSFYTGLNLDFAASTVWGTQAVQSTNMVQDPIAWGPMLARYVEETFPGAVDDPNPPDAMPLQQINAVYIPYVVRY